MFFAFSMSFSIFRDFLLFVDFVDQAKSEFKASKNKSLPKKAKL